jgi:hypothetical protein
MLPKVADWTERFSALNFLAELRDIKRMFELWKGSKLLHENAAAGYLNWELGWRPFLGDLQKMIRIIFDVKLALRIWNFDAKHKQVYTRHANMKSYIADIQGDTGYVKDTIMDRYWNSAMGAYVKHVITRREIDNSEVFFHLHYQPQYTQLKFWEQKLAFEYEVYGINQGFSIVWEAIPYSFVVDWFWDVGKFLEQFESHPFELNYKIVDFGYSVKRTKSVTVEACRPFTDVNGYALPPGGAHSGNFQYYRRMRLHPPIERLDEIDFGPLVRLKCPGWKQLFLGLSLVVV